MYNVLVLREPSDGQDRYETVFLNAGYRPLSIPVLETVHTDLNTLKDLILEGPTARGLEGVIITSKRSCDAWKEALQLLRNSYTNSRPNLNPLNVDGWNRIPFYVVGETTATALRQIFEEFHDLGLTSVDVRGQDSGNASSLAPFILDDLKRMGRSSANLLYLTGDKNRDTITRILLEAGVILEPLQVYKTQGSSSFEHHLASALASSPDDGEPWWIVYFAPSAAAFVTPVIRNFFDLTPTLASEPCQSSLRRSKIGAIGPTTDSFLRDDLHIHVDVVARKPTPEDMLAAIEEHDRGSV